MSYESIRTILRVNSPVGGALIALAVAAAYFAAGKFGLILSTVGIVSLIWPAIGVAFAAVWTYGNPAALGVFLGALGVEYASTGSLTFAVPVATGNAFATYIGAFLLRKHCGKILFSNPTMVFQFIFFAGFVGPLCSATIGACFLYVNHLIALADAPNAWLTWWGGDAVGVLMFAPPLLTLKQWRGMRFTMARGAELAGLLIVVAAYCWLIITTAIWTKDAPIGLLIVPLIIWAALRFNFAWSCLIVIIIAIWSTFAVLAGEGRFARGDIADSIIYLHIYLAAAAFTNLAVGATIASQRQALANLRRSEQRLRAMFEQASVGVSLINLAGKYEQANQRLCEIFGYSEQELLSIDPQQLSLPEDRAANMERARQLLSGEKKTVQLEKRFLRKDNTQIWGALSATLLRDESGQPHSILSIIHDVTARKNAEEKIQHLALYDTLTDLPNRQLLIDRLQHAIEVATRSEEFGAVLFVDLDRFKQINDSLGHAAGDELLRLVAQRMHGSVRTGDTIARLAGDEFVIVLENLGRWLDTATMLASGIAENIRRPLQTVFDLAGGQYSISASIGVTLFPQKDQHCTAQSLIKEADLAMYQAKESGRNCVSFYAPEFQRAAVDRINIERALRSAIANNELAVFLQPKVDTRGEIVGAEALLRWLHPQRGMISPVLFIPLAEETGLIVAIGEWVLQQVANLLCQIEAAGKSISISVNVSPRQFREPHFVSSVKQILRTSGADPRRLIIEITESIIGADISENIAKMLELQAFGIRLSLDDFGTGYSSLAYLKRLPLRELKIDRAFVADLPDDLNDIALIETIFSIAQHFQLEVVAEGVETAAQFEFLKARGCHLFQGYYFGRPETPSTHFPFLAVTSIVE